MDERLWSILIVDDDDVDVMTVKRVFAKANLANQLVVARDGVEALAVLRDGTFRRPPLTLLDINMPRMNGIEFLHEIRRDPILAPLRVVVLTTSNEDRDRVDASRLGVTSYLVKPVTFGGFADAVACLGAAWALTKSS
jgi:CheY-like chemotaxis protein